MPADQNKLLAFPRNIDRGQAQVPPPGIGLGTQAHLHGKRLRALDELSPVACVICTTGMRGSNWKVSGVG